jgi:hypothetical protein
LKYAAVLNSFSFHSFHLRFFAETGPSVAGDAFVKWATFVRKKAGGDATVPSLAVRQVVDDVEKMVKTADEWSSSGVDFAMEAEIEPETALAWLDRAIHDFVKGNDTELQRKAERHRASMEFRIELAPYYEDKVLDLDQVERKAPDVDQVERKAPRILGLLIEEKLYVEARKVCEILVPSRGCLLLMSEQESSLPGSQVSRLVLDASPIE